MSISCSICHKGVNFRDEETSVLDCGHLFHYKCLQRWLDTRTTCPECEHKITKNTFLKKIHPFINEDHEYKGTSDETKEVLTLFRENNMNFQKTFLKRIEILEGQNKEFAKKNSKLEENLKITWATMRSLQKEKKDKDTKSNKLKKDNEELKSDKKTLKKNFKTMSKELKILKDQNVYNASAFKELESENNTLKNDNEELKSDKKTLKKNLKTMSKELKILKDQNVHNELAFKDLELENNKLKNKISSMLNILSSNECLNNDLSFKGS